MNWCQRSPGHTQRSKRFSSTSYLIQILFSRDTQQSTWAVPVEWVQQTYPLK